MEKSLKKKTKKKSNKGGKRAPAKPRPSPKRSAKPDEVLYLKAKRICETLGIDTLAKKYKVEPTAEAVAAAYAASYPPVFRTAVSDGCRAGFAGR